MKDQAATPKDLDQLVASALRHATDRPYREWLVTWRREGAQWQRRILQNEGAVNVLVVELRTKDLHYRCDEAHGDCIGTLVGGPFVKWRQCSDWVDR